MTHNIRILGGPIPSSAKVIIQAPTTATFASLCSVIEETAKKAGVSQIQISPSLFNLIELEIVQGEKPRVKAHMKWTETPASSALALQCVLMLQAKTNPTTSAQESTSSTHQLRIVGGPVNKSTKLVVEVSSNATVKSLYAAAERELRILDPQAAPITDLLYEFVDLEMVDGKPKVKQLLKDDAVLSSLQLSSNVLMLKSRSSGSRPVSRADASPSGAVSPPTANGENQLNARIVGGPIPKDARVFLFIPLDHTAAQAMAMAGAECKRQSYNGAVDSDTFDFAVLDVSEGKPKIQKMLKPQETFQQQGFENAAQLVLMLKPRDRAQTPSAASSSQQQVQSPPPVAEKKAKDVKLRIVGGPIPKTSRVVVETISTTTFEDMLPSIAAQIGVPVGSGGFDFVELELVDGKPTPKRTFPSSASPESINLASQLLMLKAKDSPSTDVSRPASSLGLSKGAEISPSENASPQPSDAVKVQQTAEPVAEPSSILIAKATPAEPEPKAVAAPKDLKLRFVGGPIPKNGRVFIDVSKAMTTFGEMLALVRLEAQQLSPPVSIDGDFEFVELDMSEGKPKAKRQLPADQTPLQVRIQSSVIMLKPLSGSVGESPSVSRPNSALGNASTSSIPQVQSSPSPPQTAVKDLKLRFVGGPIPKTARIFVEVDKSKTTFRDMLEMLSIETMKLNPPITISGDAFELVELDMSDGKPKAKQILFKQDTAKSAALTSPVIMLKTKAPDGTTSPGLSRPGSALGLTHNDSKTAESAVQLPVASKPLADFKLRFVGGPIPKTSRVFLNINKSETTFKEMIGLLRVELSNLEPPHVLGDDIEFVELDVSEGKPKPKQRLQLLDTPVTSKLTTPVIMISSKSHPSSSPSVSRPTSAAVSRSSTPIAEPLTLPTVESAKPPSVVPDTKLRVVGGPIPRTARVYIDVSKADTTFEQALTDITKVLAQQVPPIELIEPFELVELDLAEGKPRPKQVLFGADTMVTAKMTSNVVMLKQKHRGMGDVSPGVSRPSSASDARHPVDNSTPQQHQASRSMDVPETPQPDMKVRFVGGPLPKAARVYVDVVKAHTTFEDMLRLVRIESAKLDPPVVMTAQDRFTLYELDVSSGGPPKIIQEVALSDTASILSHPVVLLKWVEEEVDGEQHHVSSHHASVVEAPQRPVTEFPKDLKVRFVGAAIPKASRLFVEVSRDYTTFREMLALAQAEARSLQPSIEIGDDYELAELDISSGKPMLRQTLHLDATAASAGMKSPVVMLKSHLHSGEADYSITPRRSATPSVNDALDFTVFGGPLPQDKSITLEVAHDCLVSEYAKRLCHELLRRYGVELDVDSLFEDYELYEVHVSEVSGARIKVKALSPESKLTASLNHTLEMIPVVNGCVVTNANAKVRVVGGPILKADRVFIDVNDAKTKFSTMSSIIMHKLKEMQLTSTLLSSSDYELVEVDVIDGRSTIRGVLHPTSTIVQSGMKSRIVMLKQKHLPMPAAGLSRPSSALPPTIAPAGTLPTLLIRIVGGPIPSSSRVFIHCMESVLVADTFPLIQAEMDKVAPTGVELSPETFDLVELDMTQPKPRAKRMLPLVSTVGSLGLPLKPVWALKSKHRATATPQVTPQVSPRAARPTVEEEIRGQGAAIVKIRFVGGPIAKSSRIIVDANRNEPLSQAVEAAARLLESHGGGEHLEHSLYDCIDLDMSDPSKPIPRSMLYPHELVGNLHITSGVVLLKKKEQIPVPAIPTVATMEAPPLVLPEQPSSSDIDVVVYGVPGTNGPISIHVSKFTTFKEFFPVIDDAAQIAKGNTMLLPNVEPLSSLDYDLDVCDPQTGVSTKPLNLFDSPYSEERFTGAIVLRQRNQRTPRVPKLAIGGGSDGSNLKVLPQAEPLRSPRAAAKESDGLHVSNFSSIKREDEPLRSPRRSAETGIVSATTRLRVIGSPIPRSLKVFIDVPLTLAVVEWYNLIRLQVAVADPIIASTISEDRFAIVELELDEDGNQKAKRSLPLSVSLSDLPQFESPIVMIQAKEAYVPVFKKAPTVKPVTPRKLAPLHHDEEPVIPVGGSHPVRLRIIGDPIPKEERFFISVPEDAPFSSVFPRLQELLQERLPGYPPVAAKTHELLELRKDNNGKKKVKRVLPLDLIVGDADLEMNILKIRQREDPTSPIKRAPDSTDVTPMPSPRPAPDRKMTLGPTNRGGAAASDDEETTTITNDASFGQTLVLQSSDVSIVEIRILGPQITKSEKVILKVEANKTIASLFPLIHERVIRLATVDRSAVVPVTTDNFEISEVKKEANGKRKARGSLDLHMKVGLLEGSKPILKLRYKDESLRALSVSPAVSQQVTPRGSPDQKDLSPPPFAHSELHAALASHANDRDHRSMSSPQYRAGSWVTETASAATQTTEFEGEEPQLLVQMPTMAVDNLGLSSRPLSEVEQQDASTQASPENPLTGVNFVAKISLLRGMTPNELLREISELLREALVDGRRPLFEIVTESSSVVPLVVDHPEMYDRGVQAVPVVMSKAKATETDSLELRHKSTETDFVKPSVVAAVEQRRPTDEVGVQVKPRDPDVRSIGCLADPVEHDDQWTMTVPPYLRSQAVETEMTLNNAITQTDQVPQWLPEAVRSPVEDTPNIGSPKPAPSMGRSVSPDALPQTPQQQSPLFGRRQSMAAAKVESIINDEGFAAVKAVVMDDKDTMADAKIRERIRLLEIAKKDIEASRSPKEGAQALRSSVENGFDSSSSSGPDEDEVEERRQVIRAQQQTRAQSNDEQRRSGAAGNASSPLAPVTTGGKPTASSSSSTTNAKGNANSQSFARKGTMSGSQRQSVVMFGGAEGSANGATDSNAASGSLGRSGSMFGSPVARRGSRVSTGEPTSNGLSVAVRLPSITPEPQSKPLMTPEDRFEASLPLDGPEVDDNGSPLRKQSMRRSSLEVANQSRSFRASKSSQSFKITPRLQNTMEELMKKWQQ